MSKLVTEKEGTSEVCIPLILVAESNALNRRLTCDLLKSRGYKVLEVANSRMIVEATRHNLPDLVLVDLALPGLDVLNIVRHIRSDSKLDLIPVLAVTNATINDDEAKEIQKEYDELVAKPISITLLMAKIDGILAKSKKYTIR
jgi:two-component system, cell cycle response regulator DivK